MVRGTFSLALIVTLVATSLAQVAAPPETASVAVKAVPIASGKVTLSPENTLIQFVGTHLGDSPDPRTGNFQKFQGELSVDAKAKTLKSVQVEIDIASLWTPLPPLTTHLNSPDFFDSRQFPTATFKSTSIEPGSDSAEATIHGELTLHGESKEIEFPATLAWSDKDLSLKAAFVLDRNDFGMTFGAEKVHKDVMMTIAVGAPTAKAGGSEENGPPRGEFDPTAMFKQWDADSNDSLAGDEIPERMKQRLADIDTDKNGEISKTEFEARMRQFGRGGPGGGGPGGGQGDRPARAKQRPQRPTEE